MTKRIAAPLLLNLLIGLVAGTLPAEKAHAPREQIIGRTEAVPQKFFGMHIHRALTTTPWPETPFKIWRLWDTRTTWEDLEPDRGQWRFDALDRLVALAATHEVEVLLCFGRTPTWASSNPGSVSERQSGETAPPTNMEDWRNFVRTVTTRYRGRISAYEIWNEPNLPQFYSGDVPTMIEMTREAAQIIHSIDSSATVVSPSAASWNGLAWLNAFLQAGGGQLVDAIGYHFYVTPDRPETIVPLARSVELAMADHDVKEPLWNTESGWSRPKLFATDREASAYVARSLLLAWVIGIDRFYWYAWDNTNWVTLRLSTGDDFRMNANGLAFATIESWMIGKRVDGCSTDVNGTWVCDLGDSMSKSYIVWNPDRETFFEFPDSGKSEGFWSVTDLSGKSTNTSQTNVLVDLQPRLIRFHVR